MCGMSFASHTDPTSVKVASFWRWFPQFTILWARDYTLMVHRSLDRTPHHTLLNSIYVWLKSLWTTCPRKFHNPLGSRCGLSYTFVVVTMPGVITSGTVHRFRWTGSRQKLFIELFPQLMYVALLNKTCKWFTLTNTRGCVSHYTQQSML